MGPKNHVLDGSPGHPMGRGNLLGKRTVCRDLQKRLNRSRCHLVDDSGGPKEACVTWGHTGATWRIRLNRTCAAGGDSALCIKITLTSCLSVQWNMSIT